VGPPTALQKINKAKRLEGELIMSAPPFFHSAGRGEVWCRSRRKDEEQRPFEANGKEIFSNRSEQAKPKAGEREGSIHKLKQERRRIRKEAKGSKCAQAGKRDGDRATSNAQ